MYERKESKAQRLPDWMMEKPHQVVGAAAVLGALMYKSSNQKSYTNKPNVVDHNDWETIPCLHHADDDVSTLSSSSPLKTKPPPHVVSTGQTPTVSSYLQTRNCRVQPVDCESSKSPVSSTSRPTTARVSAATLRNIQSRQRGRAPKPKLTAPTVATTVTPPKVMVTPSVTTTSPKLSPMSVGTPTTTPHVAVQKTFKIFYEHANGTECYRLHCEATACAIRNAISDLIHEDFVIQYRDEDGDTCILTDDEDVEQAIQAALGQPVVKLVATSSSSSSLTGRLKEMWNKSSWW